MDRAGADDDVETGRLPGRDLDGGRHRRRAVPDRELPSTGRGDERHLRAVFGRADAVVLVVEREGGVERIGRPFPFRAGK